MSNDSSHWRNHGCETGQCQISSPASGYARSLFGTSVACRPCLSLLRFRACGQTSMQLAAAVEEDAGQLARSAGPGLRTARHAATDIREHRHGRLYRLVVRCHPRLKCLVMFFEVTPPEGAPLVIGKDAHQVIRSPKMRRQTYRLPTAFFGAWWMTVRIFMLCCFIEAVSFGIPLFAS